MMRAFDVKQGIPAQDAVARNAAVEVLDPRLDP